ncbi:MAG: hypothetical protein FJ096_02145 [Deltaproteobacteria bacterium]|nr:hypothetical protein [Deltaproteobacteria bacterium]
MRSTNASFVALTLLVAACGGRAIWDPEHHSNRHPATSSSGAGGDEATVATSTGVAGMTGVTSVAVATTNVTSTGVGGAGGGSSTATSTSVTTAVSTAASTGSGGAPVSTSFEEVVLGNKNVNEPFTFEVPPNTLGFTVVVKAPQPYGRMGVRRIESPAKELVVDNYRIKGTGWEYSWYGLTAAGVPQSDAMSSMPAVLPGPWSVTLGDPYSGGTSGTVSVWFRTSSDGEFHGGFVDVNVFRTSNAASTPYLDNILAKAFNGWAGMALGKVTYYPLEGSFAVVDGNNYLPLIEKSAAAKTIPALNIFVIEEFSGDLKNALGIAAGIPGVGIAPGSTASGVVVMPTADPDLDAEVLKHESGHLSGLFHTTEIDGSATDPLGDTVSCKSVEQQGLGCPDSVNIMFPFANAAATEFSPMQLKVLRSATLYRGALDSIGMGNKSLPPQAATPNPGSYPTIALATGAWRTHVTPDVADLLAAHWCHDGNHVNHAAVAGRFASKADLAAVAADLSAPAWLRARAKQASAAATH